MRAGLRLQRRHRITANGGGQRKRIQSGLFDRRTERQAAHVTEHFTNRDRVRRLAEQHVVAVFLGNDHLTAKLRQMFLDRIVECDLPLVDKHHDRRCRDPFRLRRDPENRVCFHRLPGFDIGESNRFDRQNFVFVCDKCDSAGKFMTIDERLQYLR